MTALYRAGRCTMHPGGRLVIAPEWAGKIAALVCGSSYWDGRRWGTYAKGTGQTFAAGKRGPALRTNSDSEAGVITFAQPPNRQAWGFVFVGRAFSSSLDGAWNIGDSSAYAYISSSGGLSLAQSGITSHFTCAADFTPVSGAVAGYFRQAEARGAVYRDGTLYASGSHSPASATLTSLQCGSRHQTESTRSWRGEQELLVILNGEASEAEVKALSANPWQIFEAPRRVYFDLGASGSYVLTAEAGSYALTGGAALFNTAMSASGGSYAATGGDATFSTKLAAGQGDYALSGGDAAFPLTWSGEAGSYSLSGGDAAFAINWIASGGDYTLTGGNAVFQYGSGATLIGEAGDYVLTGGDATFAVTFVGAGESYALTGGEALFSAGLACGAGSYTYTGGAASFALNAVCGAGSYALSGGDTVFNVGFVAGEGAYTYAGGDAAFNYSSGDIILSAEAGAYALTGGDAQFVIGLAAGAGNYNWSGGDAAWAVNWVGAGGSYVLTGGTANFVDSGNQSVANLLRTQSVYLRLVDGTYYLRLADPTTYIRLQ